MSFYTDRTHTIRELSHPCRGPTFEQLWTEIIQSILIQAIMQEFEEFLNVSWDRMGDQ